MTENYVRITELTEQLIERHLGALNKLESHLGCAKCYGPLIDGKCPACQQDEFEIGNDGKLHPR